MRFVVHGEREYHNSTTDYSFGTWEFNGTAWTEKASFNPTPTITEGDVKIAYDPLHKATVLYGVDYVNNTSITALYDGNADTWSQLSPTPQPPVFADGALMQYNPSSSGILLLGGVYDNQYNEIDQSWLWNGSIWSRITGAQPENGSAGGMAYDQARGEMVLLSPAMATWVFNGTDWIKEMPPASPPYADAGYFTLAYQPQWQTALFFGGEVVDAQSNTKAKKCPAFEAGTRKRSNRSTIICAPFIVCIAVASCYVRYLPETKKAKKRWLLRRRGLKISY